MTTDGAGAASYTFSPPGAVPAGQFLTATATGPDGTTSEFSGAVAVPAAAAADLVVDVTDAPDPVAAGGDLTYSIVVTLTDAIPAGTTFISLTAPVGWTATTPPVGSIGTPCLISFQVRFVVARVTIEPRPVAINLIPPVWSSMRGGAELRIYHSESDSVLSGGVTRHGGDGTAELSITALVKFVNRFPSTFRTNNHAVAAAVDSLLASGKLFPLKILGQSMD